jgi:diguanylate cyclase (GGDEF)-like protein
MFPLRRPLATLVLAVTVVATALVYAFQVQRDVAITAAGRTESAVAALTAMLDQETGMRGFLLNGQDEFLEPYVNGQGAYEEARTQVSKAAARDATSIRLAELEDATARSWQDGAAQRIAARRHNNPSEQVQAQQALLGRQQMSRFRSVNAELRVRFNQRRDAELRLTSTVSTLAALFVLIGFLRLQRGTRQIVARGEKEIAYRVRQREFSDLIQAVDSESAAHQLVERNLERSLPGVCATVLMCSNAGDRLHAATELPANSVLNQTLTDADPQDCLAICLSRPHRDGADDNDELISCKLCSRVPGIVSCQPLLVGGRVIGSVLIEEPHPLDEAERRAVTDIVSQAAPVLANLKTIAIAEKLASTDALTGLPNRRAMHDTLKRMAAQAGRTAQPLAAIAFDLDRFKTINDFYGHETGDVALAAVGECLRETLRESDFAARVGGEEFLVLAPNTDTAGAELLAEKLLEALTRKVIPNLLQPLTASFGVAVLPDHVASSEMLLSRADRASYLAKARGRNRVETASNDLPLSELGEANTGGDRSASRRGVETDRRSRQ